MEDFFFKNSSNESWEGALYTTDYSTQKWTKFFFFFSPNRFQTKELIFETIVLVWFFLFNGISTFMGYLIPKQSF